MESSDTLYLMIKKIILFLLVVGVAVWFWKFNIKQPAISNFDECVLAGNPVMESYPRVCRTKQGQSFSESIGNEQEKTDLIQIESPRPNTEISSPVIIRGKARGTWFFEGSFPVKLIDDKDTVIGNAIATADGEWMTQDFVPFTASLTFSPSGAKKGKLILLKENPSGLPENEDFLEIPLSFTSGNEVKLYYYSKELDPNGDCTQEAIVPVKRSLNKTQTPIQDAIRMLITGDLTSSEKASGLTTEFPLEGFELKGANLKNGELTLEFIDPKMKTSGGSCRVNLLWSQIEKTATQFPEVKSVNFIPKDLFQP